VPCGTTATWVRTCDNKVGDLEGWIQQWLQSVYANAAIDTPSIAATISEDEYLTRPFRVFKSVNLAVKAEHVEEPLASSSSSAAVNPEVRHQVNQP